MLNSNLIAAAKRILIGASIPARDTGMLVLIAIIYIGATVVSGVLACPLDTVTETAALDVLIPRRGIFPALLRAISISRRRWPLCNEASGDERQSRCCHNSQ
jgi:hypothetical protein